ncbi:MAG: hypothetical protein AAGG51_29540 [Cyanobacteria bacterium P01_G01_bin.54]
MSLTVFRDKLTEAWEKLLSGIDCIYLTFHKRKVVAFVSPRFTSHLSLPLIGNSDNIVFVPSEIQNHYLALKDKKYMYHLKYADTRIKFMLSDKDTFWDAELRQELEPILKKLKETGEVVGASCYFKPGINGLIYELKGRTFQLVYAVNAKIKEIKVYEFKQISHPLDWKLALEKDLYLGEDSNFCIPQIGDPDKFIRAVDFIYQGVDTAEKLGIAFGSPAKNPKNLARRGDYLGRPLIEFKLANRLSQSYKPSKYILTDLGNRIAESKDRETRERLIVESLLGYYPIQLIIEKTTRDGQDLTKELIQEVITLVSLDDCGGQTNPRRASSLRAIVNYVSRWAGIPICREGSNGVQLYIPYIYS